MFELKSYLNTVILDINRFANPGKTYEEYEQEKMYEYYRNFLEMAAIILDDRCIKENIREGKFKDWGLSKTTINSLYEFSKHVDTFYETKKNSDSDKLLQDKYWSNLVPEAKKCVEALEKDIAKMED